MVLCLLPLPILTTVRAVILVGGEGGEGGGEGVGECLGLGLGLEERERAGG